MDPTRIRTPSPVSIDYTETSESPRRPGERRLPDSDTEPSAAQLDTLLSLAQELISSQAASSAATGPAPAPGEEDATAPHSVCVFKPPQPPAKSWAPGAEAGPPDELELCCLLDQRSDAGPSASHLRLRCFMTGGGCLWSPGTGQSALQCPAPSSSPLLTPGSLLRDPPCAPSSLPTPGSLLRDPPCAPSPLPTPGSLLRDPPCAPSPLPTPGSLLREPPCAPSAAAVSEMYRAAESIWDAELSVLSSADDYCPAPGPATPPRSRRPLPTYSPAQSRAFQSYWSYGREQLEGADGTPTWPGQSPGTGSPWGLEPGRDPGPGPNLDLGPSWDADPDRSICSWAGKVSGAGRCVWVAPTGQEEVERSPESIRSPRTSQPDKGPALVLDPSHLSRSQTPSQVSSLSPSVKTPIPGQSPKGPGLGQSPRGPGLGQSPRGPSLGQSPGGTGLGQSPRGPSLGQSPKGPVPGQSPGGTGLGQSPRGPSLGQSPGGLGLGQSPRSPSPGQSPKGSGVGQSPKGLNLRQSPANSQIQYTGQSGEQEGVAGVSSPSLQSLEDIEPFPLGRPSLPFPIRSEQDLVQWQPPGSVPAQQRASATIASSLSRLAANQENQGRSVRGREHTDPFTLQPSGDTKD